MAIDPSQPSEVGQALLAYLGQRLGAPGLGFAEAPVQFTDGWETYTFAFRLASEGLEPAFARRLILRIYPSDDQAERAEQEAAVQRFAAERGYPAPRPLVVEAGANALGRPFMIREHAPGVPMFDRVAGKPAVVARAAALMADMHVALHCLPVDGCPLPRDGALVDRQFAAYSDMLALFGLGLPQEAEEPLEWLRAHKGMVMQEEVSLCHHDFHPLNILVDDDWAVSVIDWPGAALGDRHSDVARTLVELRTAPIDPSTWVEKLMVRFGRGTFVRLYLRRYRQQLALDRERLRYWEAMHAFEWLVMIRGLESVDLAAIGVKPDTAARIPADHFERMRRYFWQRARS